MFVFTAVYVILKDLWKGHSFNLRLFIRHALVNTDFFSFRNFYKLTGYVLQNFKSLDDYDPKHVTAVSCHYKSSFSKAILTAKIQMATKIFSTFSLTIDIEQFFIKTLICTNNFHCKIHTVSKVELGHVSIDTNFYHTEYISGVGLSKVVYSVWISKT